MIRREISLSADLRLSHQRLSQNAWVLTPHGAIDSVSSDEFSNRIRKFLEENTPAPNVLLDMSGVKYISSIGLGALIGLLRKTKESGASFGLYNPQLAVQRVLEISKLDFLLVKPDSLETAGPFNDYIRERESERAPKETPKK